MINTILLALFALIFGSLLCFGGYRIFMVMLPIWCFFGGLWLGAKGFALLFGTGFLAMATGLTLGLVLGVILALLSWQFYSLGAALLGAMMAAWLGAGFMHALGFSGGFLVALIAFLCGAIAGLLILLRGWQKYLIMLITSIFGSNAIVLALLLPTEQVSIEDLQVAGTAVQPVLQAPWIWTLIWLGLAIAGVILQHRSYRQTVFIQQEFVKFWS
jgi:hypothetical protein